MKNFDESYEIRVPKLGADGGVVRDPKTQQVQMETITVSRNERATSDHGFAIGGESFDVRPAVAPQSILKWTKMTAGEIDDLTEEIALDIYDETILAFLTPGQQEKWEHVRRADAPNPLTLQDLAALVRWLFEEQTGRPTQRPSSSSNGSGTDGTTTGSTERSSTEPVAV